LAPSPDRPSHRCTKFFFTHSDPADARYQGESNTDAFQGTLAGPANYACRESTRALLVRVVGGPALCLDVAGPLSRKRSAFSRQAL
jgi:hypothetical protein